MKSFNIMNLLIISVVGILVGLWSGCVVCQCDAHDVEFLVYPKFFDSMHNNSRNESGCPGRSFYTRKAFLKAFKSFPDFARSCHSEREIAAFFAHVTHATDQLCKIEQINPPNNYCDHNHTQYTCVPGKAYYGRGPLQITWNYNYGPAGNYIGFDGLNAPETVAKDPVVAFKTALWIWMKNAHMIMVRNEGFGKTIEVINGDVECFGDGPTDEAMNRLKYYKKYCHELGVTPGDNLFC